MARSDETIEQRDAPDASSDPDEELDLAALGQTGTSDEAEGLASEDVESEIDAIGEAAGMVVRDDKPLRGIDEVERRDDHRWELDPASADDGFVRGTD